jgi:hypothetical protein
LPVPAGVSYKRQVFLSSGTFTLPKTAYNKFDCLLVSGGGGGARSNTTGAVSAKGGTGLVGYFSEVYCTNETVLTITVGAGGTGATSAGNNGGNGNASTITGIAGNGASTSLSSGIARGGEYSSPPTLIQPNISTAIAGGLRSGPGSSSGSIRKNVAFGVGFGGFTIATGSDSGYDMSGTSIFSAMGGRIQYFSGTGVSLTTASNSTGGPIPLAGSLLHATQGASGTAGTLAGGTSLANTFFAGSGGGAFYTSYTGRDGQGGGGGGGGPSTSGGTFSGAGGNASTNSGGGGGAGGKNSATAGNTGNGGNGGSGFVVIGYWG